jgi:IS5 family transposase
LPDARWTKKGNETHFGYKDHVKVDAGSKMIVTFEVTPASTHDSQTFVALLDEKDDVVNADSAYVGEELEAEIRAKLDDPETDKKITLNINGGY